MSHCTVRKETHTHTQAQNLNIQRSTALGETWLLNTMNDTSQRTGGTES